MRRESDCPPEERYLFANVALAPKVIASWKERCREMHEKRDKGEAYRNFMEWEPQANEMAIYTQFAYADLEMPRTFDCVFHLDSREEFTETSIMLLQSVWNGWIPINGLDHGHRHLCIFRFDDGVPAILDKLFVLNERDAPIPKDSPRLAFCTMGDFEFIKRTR